MTTTGINQSQGYPTYSKIAEPGTGNLTQPWRQFFIALWNRTGGQLGGFVQSQTPVTTGALAKFFNSTVLASTNLTGDVTTSNSEVTTLATVNSNVGTFNFATMTVNAKGLVTAASSGSPLAGGINAVITTAALSGTGTQGSMTFTNGLLTAQTPAT